MRGIPIYEANETDFGTNGLGLLYPLSCEVECNSDALYELTIEMPLVPGDKYSLLQPQRILKAVVPVPEAPVVHEYDGDPDEPSSGEIWRIKGRSRVNLRQKPTSNSKSLGVYGPAEMLLLQKTTPNWYHVQILDGGAVGYMRSSYLEYVRPASGGGGDDVVPDISRTQLFRIYSVNMSTQQQKVTAKALHIFYDLSGNILDGEYKPEKEDVQTVIATAFSMLDDNDFALYIGDIEGEITGDYSYKSFVEVLLNPSDGILSQIDAQLLRDNYSIYIVPMEHKDRGVQIRRGKNLRSLTVDIDTSEMVTRVLPVGEKSNGDPLYIDSKYVISPNAGRYPLMATKQIKYDVKVESGGEYPTEQAAKEAIQRMAEEEFSVSHIDEPAYGMTVDFQMMEDVPEYAQFAKLQKIFMHDLVTVQDAVLGVDTQLEVSAFIWNVLLEKFNSLTIGVLLDS